MKHPSTEDPETVSVQRVGDERQLQDLQAVRCQSPTGSGPNVSVVR